MPKMTRACTDLRDGPLFNQSFRRAALQAAHEALLLSTKYTGSCFEVISDHKLTSWAEMLGAKYADWDKRCLFPIPSFRCTISRSRSCGVSVGIFRGPKTPRSREKAALRHHNQHADALSQNTVPVCGDQGMDFARLDGLSGTDPRGWAVDAHPISGVDRAGRRGEPGRSCGACGQGLRDGRDCR